MGKKIILLGIVALALGGGFLLGQYSSSSTEADTSSAEESGQEIASTTPNQESETESEIMLDANTDEQLQTEAVIVDTSALDPGQQKALKRVGVDADSITITPEMIACAEEKVGVETVTAIQNGSTPSFIEATKLLTCYAAG